MASALFPRAALQRLSADPGGPGAGEEQHRSPRGQAPGGWRLRGSLSQLSLCLGKCRRRPSAGSAAAEAEPAFYE